MIKYSVTRAFASMAMAMTLALAHQAAAQPIPDEVYDLVVNQEFDPGDFTYLRGAYPGASEGEIAQWNTISNWLSACRAKAISQYRDELAELGVTLSPDHVSEANTFCSSVITPDHLEGITEFSQIEEALPTSRLVFDTLTDTLEMTQLSLYPSNATAGRQLEVGRIAVDVLQGVPGGPLVSQTAAAEAGDIRSFSQLDPHENAVLQALIASELVLIDETNTDLLKSIVRETGWPMISEVGEGAVEAAFVMLQRADSDPVFQVQTLRMIEALIETGEVSRQYPFTYDRIMLKLSGKQRYATQTDCENGEVAPLPLEDPANVDELREKMGLGNLAGYLTLRQNSCAP